LGNGAVRFAFVVVVAYPVGFSVAGFPFEKRPALSASNPFAQRIHRAFRHGRDIPALVQLLRPFENIAGDNCGMRVFDIVFVLLAFVALFLERQDGGGVPFLQQGVACIPFIFQEIVRRPCTK